MTSAQRGSRARTRGASSSRSLIGRRAGAIVSRSNRSSADLRRARGLVSRRPEGGGKGETPTHPRVRAPQDRESKIWVVYGGHRVEGT